jgi:hypothetical protein
MLCERGTTMPLLDPVLDLGGADLDNGEFGGNKETIREDNKEDENEIADYLR